MSIEFVGFAQGVKITESEPLPKDLVVTPSGADDNFLSQH
jgi:hypothetical protein